MRERPCPPGPALPVARRLLLDPGIRRRRYRRGRRVRRAEPEPAAAADRRDAARAGGGPGADRAVVAWRGAGRRRGREPAVSDTRKSRVALVVPLVLVNTTAIYGQAAWACDHLVPPYAPPPRPPRSRCACCSPPRSSRS